ncbi:hypothetical protein EVAR_96226_1 [Eumeta japonica]|uniref:Uncharacterized protein n=1 Tax=Eumeta variegata TaxID=151549 RepID=A0A4C1WLB0_EUMVA|nr:hypothetical protein EVAR_96226_1 [Eumeta japonica]
MVAEKCAKCDDGARGGDGRRRPPRVTKQQFKLTTRHLHKSARSDRDHLRRLMLYGMTETRSCTRARDRAHLTSAVKKVKDS